MTVTDLLLPVFVQVGLTFFIMFWMGILRRRALSSGAVQPSDIALREPKWPTRALQVANNFQNQLELPMLFYVLVAFILITSTNSLIFVILAWVFVLARLVHAYIHTGSNELYSRSAAIGVAAIALVAMWVIFAIRILITGA
ncbi:MAG: MAPEG family protein [Hyphomicrobium sp.]|nr:MAPEG family protein [Hyphomicrobium sp.]